MANWNKYIENWGYLFFNRRRSIMPPEIKVNNTAIKWFDSVRYLGIVSDKRPTFSAQMNYAVLKANKTTCLKYPLFNCKSSLDVNDKLNIYKALTRPTIAYSCPVWCSDSNASFNKLQLVQNKCLRCVLNASRYIIIVDMYRHYIYL